MPMLARATPATVPQPSPPKKSANAGSATSSVSTRNASTASDLPSQIALRSQGASSNPSISRCSRSATKARTSASIAVKRITIHKQACAHGLRVLRRHGEVEDDEARDDEEHHRGQRLAAAQLEQHVLPRERGRVVEVAPHASVSEPLASAASRSGSWVATRHVADVAQLGQLAVEQVGARLVEGAVRLVEDQQLGVVEQRTAEREALRHAARERRHELSPHVPEAEALEQHADPLAPLRNRVQAPVEVEVLERRQLLVDERLVPEEADRATVRVHLQLARRRRRQPGAEPQQRRLAGAVGPGDDEEAAAGQLEVHSLKNALVAVALREAARSNHVATSRSTKQKNTMLITPFSVKNAVFSRRRSPGETIACSYASSAATAPTPSQ